MKNDNLRYDNILKIILTHAHPDHAQSLPVLARRLMAQIYCHPREKSVVEDPSLLWEQEYEIMGPFERELMVLPRAAVEWLTRLMFGAMRPFRDNVTAVRDGAILNLGIPAGIVGLPGHRPGEIGIHIPDDKILIIGDLVNYKMYDIPSVNMPQSNLQQAMASLRRIQRMDIDILAPCHDHPVTGREKIREWLQDAQERCALMRRTAEQELAGDPHIPLPRLGKILAGRNQGINFFQRRMLAYNVLKSLEPVDEHTAHA